MTVHFNVGGGRVACNAGRQWMSCVLTSNKDPEAVTCGGCKGTFAWRKAIEQ